MVMPRAPRVERGAASWAMIAAGQIFLDGELRAADAAQHRCHVALRARQRLERMIGECIVTGGAGVVLAAAPGANRDHVQRGVPVRAAGLGVERHTQDAGDGGGGHLRKMTGAGHAAREFGSRRGRPESSAQETQDALPYCE